jgi:hypothetical protein
MRWAIKSETGALSDQKKVVFRELLNYQNAKCHKSVIWTEEITVRKEERRIEMKCTLR